MQVRQGTNGVDSNQALAVVGHVLAVISFAAAIGYVFVTGHAIAHRYGIAFEYDAWHVIEAVPFGFAEGDFLAAGFGISASVIAWVWGTVRRRDAWYICCACVVLVWSLALFMSVVSPGGELGGAIMLLFTPYMVPVVIWMAIAREHQPQCLRRSGARALKKKRDKLSMFERSSYRRLRNPARRYAGFVLAWASVGVGMWTMMIARVTRYNITINDMPVLLSGPEFSQAVWVLRADSAGYFFMTQEDETIGWVQSADVTTITPAEPLMKAGGHVDRRRQETQARVWLAYLFAAVTLVFAAAIIVLSAKRDRLMARQRLARRRSRSQRARESDASDVVR